MEGRTTTLLSAPHILQVAIDGAELEEIDLVAADGIDRVDR